MGMVNVRSLTPEDRDWVRAFIAEQWGAATVVAHGRQYLPHELPGFVAMQEETPVGLVRYQIEGSACEIVTIDSLRPNQGIGTLLLDAVARAARRSGCRRLWLITANDNLNALRFYQRRGMTLVAIYRNAVARSRELKPEIAFIGAEGIRIRDEIELERILNDEATAAIGSLIQIGPDMIEAASEVLTRAFFDDPMTVFILPVASRRPEILPALYGAAIAHACRSDGAYTTEALDAVALWAPPDAAAMTPDQALVATDGLAAQMEAEERDRLALLVEHLERLRQRYAPSPHWYLDILGVDPPRQGQGVGGRMIEPILRRADASGVDCYLETFKERNLAFYQKHGFVALAEEQIPNGPRFWPMLRTPDTGTI